MKKTISSLAVVAALVSPSVFAHSEGDFILRVGAASVVPNDSGDKILGSQEKLKVVKHPAGFDVWLHVYRQHQLRGSSCNTI